MSKREHIPSPIKPNSFSRSGSTLPSPVKLKFSQTSHDDTSSIKRKRSSSFEDDKENQNPSQSPSSPKKARVEVVKQELVIVKKDINELQDIKDHYVKFVEATSSSSTTSKDLEAERARTAELEKALAALEAKALHRKEKKQNVRRR